MAPSKISRCAGIVLLFAATALNAAEEKTLAQSDKVIGLHSGGGPWKFYRQARKGDLPRVLLIGDSIMNGYRGRVIGAFKGRAVVDCWLTPLHLKSQDLHHDLRKVLEQGPYDVVHFNIGLHGWTPGRIPKGQYEPLLRRYVETIKSHSESSRLIWASSTQITVKDKPTELDPVHNQTMVDRNAIAARVMPEYGIAVNDLYGLMRDKLKMAKGDRFHWNGQAYDSMAKQVTRHIETALIAEDEKEPNRTHTLVWTSPSSGSEGSMPIGNGEIGANVWVEENGDLLFYLSKTDAWSENGRLLKLGKVRVALTPNPFQEAACSTRHWMWNAAKSSSVSRSPNRTWRSGLPWTRNHPVVTIDIDSEQPVEAMVSLEHWRLQAQRVERTEAHSAYGLLPAGGESIVVAPIFVEPDTIMARQKDRVVWYHRNERSIWKANLELQALEEAAEKQTDPLLHRTFGALIEGEGSGQSVGHHLEVGPTGKGASRRYLHC